MNSAIYNKEKTPLKPSKVFETNATETRPVSTHFMTKKCFNLLYV